MIRRIPRSVAALFALVLVSALVLSGCGAKSGKVGNHPSASVTPTPSVTVPAGVSLTAPGTSLTFGSAATVAYRPNTKRGTVLKLTVTKVTKASIKDFSTYVLDARTLASTPYYVDVEVTNLGDGDVGGTDVPLWAVDGTNTLIHSSTFTNTFQRCPSRSLPASFAPQSTTKACLVYLLPNHGSLASVSFRPLQRFAPIVWTGTVIDETAAKKATKKSAKSGASKKSKKASH